MKTISRADVAWHILALAENPAPAHQRSPVITTGASRNPARPGPGTSPPGRPPRSGRHHDTGRNGTGSDASLLSDAADHTKEPQGNSGSLSGMSGAPGARRATGLHS